MRIASLPKWFQTTIEEVNDDDRFLFRGINNGIPARTSTRLDLAVISVLQMARAKITQVQGCDVPRTMLTAVARQFQSADKYAYRVHAKRRRSALLDTGANHSLFHRDVEPFMHNPKESFFFTIGK